MDTNFSDYIVYVDESGDHGLMTIDPQYPIFVLVFCIFKKEDYLTTVHKVQQFKFDYFGHDLVVLHESDIRRDKGEFRVLRPKARKTAFLNQITQLIDMVNFTVIAAVIDKNRLKEKYTRADNPYHIALKFCVERTHRYFEEQGVTDKTTHVVFEQRGKNEDDELELEFRRVCDGDNYFNSALPFSFVKAHKACNSTGLQFADLLARPIGLSVLRPEQENRAFDIAKKKLRSHQGRVNGFGLKVFP